MSESASANTTSSSAGQASGRRTRGRTYFVTAVEKCLAMVESEEKKFEVELDALKWLSPLIKQGDAISEPPERESRRKVGHNLGTDLGSYVQFYIRSIHNKKRVRELEFDFLEKVRELAVNAKSNSGAFVSMKNSNKKKVVKQWLDDCEQPPFQTQNPASVARIEAIEFCLDSDFQPAQSSRSEAVTSATYDSNLYAAELAQDDNSATT